jgi:hypothetical protein
MFWHYFVILQGSSTLAAVLEAEAGMPECSKAAVFTTAHARLIRPTASIVTILIEQAFLLPPFSKSRLTEKRGGTFDLKTTFEGRMWAVNTVLDTN